MLSLEYLLRNEMASIGMAAAPLIAELAEKARLIHSAAAFSARYSLRSRPVRRKYMLQA
jgi:hypothetical protein